MESFREESNELELRDYLAVLRRRKLIIALTTALVVAAALTTSLLQTDVYATSARVLLGGTTSERLFSPEVGGGFGGIDPDVETEIEVMESRSVTDAVVEALGSSPTVSVAARGDTRVVAITAEDVVPADAAEAANTYAAVYITIRREQLLDELLLAVGEVQDRINEIDGRLAELDEPLVDLDAEIAAAELESEREALLVERTRIDEGDETTRQALQNQRAVFTQQIGQFQLSSNLARSGGAQLVSKAEVPAQPIRPTPMRNAILALVVGLMLGVGLAFLRDHLDDTVTTKEDLERATSGLTVLSLIPAVAGWTDRGTTRLVSRTEPRSPAAEAYRALRTSVQFIEIGKPIKLLQLTSPSASEGKTTTLANLALSLAGAGQRVIVVCCDLRRPRVHEFFDLTNTVGFTSVLLGRAQLAEALQPVDGVSDLWVLASGPPPPNPAELLASPATRALFETLKGEADIILIDSPPLLPVTDGVILGGLVDSMILVVGAGKTTRKDAHRAVELLHQVDAPLVGSVLNGVSLESTYGYGRGYGYGYGRGYGYGPTVEAPAAEEDHSNGQPSGVVAEDQVTRSF